MHLQRNRCDSPVTSRTKYQTHHARINVQHAFENLVTKRLWPIFDIETNVSLPGIKFILFLVSAELHQINRPPPTFAGKSNWLWRCIDQLHRLPPLFQMNYRVIEPVIANEPSKHTANSRWTKFGPTTVKLVFKNIQHHWRIEKQSVYSQN